MRLLTAMTFGLCLVLYGSAAPAQEAQQDKSGQAERKVLIEQNQIVVTGPGGATTLPVPPVGLLGTASGGNTVNFVTSELSFNTRVVKGAPYSADAVTETVQTLADGNRIVRKSSAKVYRDGEGRTRREQTFTGTGTGTLAATAGGVQTIFINDPVAGVNYILDPKTQTARKMTVRIITDASKAPAIGARIGPSTVVTTSGQRTVTVYSNAETAAAAAAGQNVVIKRDGKDWPKPVTESLGKQTVEGVEAEGTRTTVTIPAGQIGNERPIDIVNERWYSPALQTVVMSKRSDPMAGETTYRLTNIDRSEPARSLFEVPADYKIKEGGSSFFEFRTTVKKPGEEK
ncbi:MAG TPA: hypothetical protein VF507_10330 [Pyrinomonadaceae bacterium]